MFDRFWERTIDFRVTPAEINSAVPDLIINQIDFHVRVVDSSLIQSCCVTVPLKARDIAARILYSGGQSEKN